MTLILRSTKGSPLTHQELDDNLEELSNFTQSGSGAVERSVTSKLSEVVSVKDFGALGNGSTDDTSAINLAIAWLNAAAFRAIYFPPGNYVITGALTTILQSGSRIYGAGLDATRITVASSVSPSTLGTVFTVGSDASSAIGRVTIDGFGINFANTPSVTENPFVFKNCSDVRVDNIYLSNAAGFVTLGSSSAAVNRFKARAVEGNYTKGGTQGGYKVIEIVQAITCSFDNVTLLAASSTGTSYSVHIAPTSGGFVDEVRFHNCTIWSNDQSHGFYIDVTNEKVVNVWVDKCVFDANAVASFMITSSSGSKECRNIHVRDTRLEVTSAAGANCVRITHSGTGIVTGVDFTNSHMSYKAAKAVTVAGTLRDIVFDGCRFQDSNATTKSAALSFATGGFTVRGCRFYKFDATGSTTSAVETTDDVDNFTVTGNKAPQLAGAFMTHYAYASYSSQRIVRDNVGASDPQPIILGASGAAVDATNDTNENTIATITVPANALGNDGRIEVVTLWSFTSSANVKTPRVRFSGGAGTVYMAPALTTVASAKYHASIANRGATNSQVGGQTGATGGWGTAGAAVATSSVDTTAATTIVITSQKDAASVAATETMRLESYSVMLYPR